MDERREGERRSSPDRREPIFIVENKYCEKLKVFTIKVTTTIKVTYIGDFHLPEVKRRLSDSINDEKTFINLTNVSIDESSNVIAYIALNKDQIVSIEELPRNRGQKLNEGKAAA